MDYKYNLYGNGTPDFLEFDIAAATAIKRGQVVKLTAGLVVLAVIADTAAILGVAVEDHTGAADTLNPRANGLKIKVYASPGAVFSSKALSELTGTSGSGTTFAATGLAAYADNDFVNGYLILTAKAAASTLTDAIGTIYKVTGSTAATKLFTGVFPGNASAGDKMLLIPPIMFNKGNLDSTIQSIDYITAATGTVCRVVDVDLKTREIYWSPALHLLGNKAS